jgi:hypothetical protein
VYREGEQQTFGAEQFRLNAWIARRRQQLALVPGQDANEFKGSGWVLTGGAMVTGGALDLPSGSTQRAPRCA